MKDTPTTTKVRLSKQDAGQIIYVIERQVLLLSAMIQLLARHRLMEAQGVKKPLTPDQLRKRAERDRQRQQQIKDIRTSAASRIAEIRTRLGK